MARKTSKPLSGAALPVRAPTTEADVPPAQTPPIPSQLLPAEAAALGAVEASSTRVSLDLKIPGLRFLLGWAKDRRGA